MTRDLEKRVRDIVAEKLKVESARVTREANFIDDLGADSLDLTDMILTLEKELGKSISENEADTPKTFGELLDRIAESEAPSRSAEGGFTSRFFAGLRGKRL